MTLTLRRRVLLTQLPLALLLVVLGAGGTLLLDRLGSGIDAILHENYDSVVAMQRLNRALDDIDSSFQLALAGREAAARTQYRESWRSYRENLRIEQANITVIGEAEAVAKLTALTDRYQHEGDTFYGEPAGAPARSTRYFAPSGLLDLFTQIKDARWLIVQLNEANMEQASHDAKAAAARSHTWLVAMLAATAILAAFAGWRTVRATLAPIVAITRSATAISSGDLDRTVSYSSPDELGKLAHTFNEMVEQLRVSRQAVEQRAAQLLDANDRLAAQVRERERAERKYRSIFENAIVGIFQTTPAGAYIDVNPAMAHMLGYASAGELMSAVHDIGRQIYADPARRVDFMRALRDGAVSGFEAEYVCKDRTTIWITLTARAVRDEAGSDAFYEGFAVDITARRRAEQDLRRLNRAYRALSSCNQSLIRADAEPAWLQEVCRMIVEEAGYRMCWVGYAEHDEGKTVRTVAQAGFDAGYLENARITWADTERGRGPTGTCIRTRETATSWSIAGDPRLAPWRAEALKRGFASSIALPLLVEADAIGALTIYAAEPDAFGDDEVRLLTELTGDLAYGITTLRTRAERMRAQGDLRALNAELEQRVVARTTELHAAREREVETGFKIQNMLLLDKPPRDLPGIDVAALTVPSQQISGDFYGFLLHENHCLDVVIADVMGKGIPAALLGAAAKSHFPEAMWHLMSTAAPGELPAPRDLVTLAHTHMARELIELESFVTLCYARIDRRARCLELVDCGHTGTLHLQARTGRCLIIHGSNAPLGVIEGEIFDQLSVPFDTGDVFLFYSDGVTEARDEHGELFGAQRLIECVQRNAAVPPVALIEAVRDAAVAFSRSSPLRDDLTCVAIKVVDFEPPLACAELELVSELTELRRARDFVRGFCAGPSRALLDEDELAALELAVDEAVSNIIKHAYGGRSDQRIHVSAAAYRGHVAVRLRHVGTPFDRLAVVPPALDGSRESGFGVYLIESSVDAVRYGRDELGRNCIDLEKRRRAKLTS